VSERRPDSGSLTFWAGRHAVYRCYDATGRLMYIGYSGDVVRRLWEHRWNTWWSPQLAKIRVTLHRTREAALAAEKAAIVAERPAFNTAHITPGLRPRSRDHWGPTDRLMHAASIGRDRQVPWAEQYMPPPRLRLVLRAA
jgi:predicted GIY-YIG superfamily endonuclease